MTPGLAVGWAHKCNMNDEVCNDHIPHKYNMNDEVCNDHIPHTYNMNDEVCNDHILHTLLHDCHSPPAPWAVGRDCSPAHTRTDRLVVGGQGTPAPSTPAPSTPHPSPTHPRPLWG